MRPNRNVCAKYPTAYLYVVISVRRCKDRVGYVDSATHSVNNYGHMAGKAGAAVESNSTGSRARVDITGF